MLSFNSGVPPSPSHTGQAPLSAPSVPIRLNFVHFRGLYFARRYASLLLAVALSIRPDV